jgi:hypothetical protein
MEYVPPSRTFEAMPEFVEGLGSVGVSVEGSLTKPTTVRKDTRGQPETQPFDTASPTAGALLETKPPKYSDSCDAENYDAATGTQNWRNYLGASYEGVPACGPRPTLGGIELQTTFAADATSPVTQFDAAELSLRWLYLAYETPPFSGNGDQLYDRYDATAGGRPLVAIAASRSGGYLPHGGDVLSYDTGGSGGHTSVVVASHVDAGGDGWVDVVEQNGASGGYARLLVLKHVVLSNYGGFVTGWLTPHQR